MKAATTRYETVRSAFSRYLKTNKSPSRSGRDNVILDSRWDHLRWLVRFIRYREGTTSYVTVGPRKEPSLSDDIIIDGPIEESAESLPITSAVRNEEDNDGSTTSASTSQIQSQVSSSGE